MGYVFYDTETTGVETSFDQILQFGAIYTDDDLNEVERLDLRCQLLPNVVPHPKALIITGVGPETFLNEELPSHYEMVETIRSKLIEWSPSLILGYNSIDFDEVLVRQALYKTLHDPYLTNTLGNLRADVLSLVRAANSLAPGVLEVPLNEKGRPTFKLDQLAPANGFEHTNAHEALSDVEATIFMARKIKESLPHIWESAKQTASRKLATEMITETPCFVQSVTYFGTPYNYVMTFAGNNPKIPYQVTGFDLDNNPEYYLDADVDGLIDAITKQPKAIRKIRSNASPVILAADDILEFFETTAESLETYKERAGALVGNHAFQSRVGDALARISDDAAEGREESPYIEEQIYSGFLTPQDKARLVEFRKSNWESRLTIVNSLADPRYRELGIRVIYCERPEILEEVDRNRMDNWVKQQIFNPDPKVPWTTLNKARLELEEISKMASSEQQVLLNSISDFYGNLEGKWSKP